MKLVSLIISFLFCILSALNGISQKWLWANGLEGEITHVKTATDISGNILVIGTYRNNINIGDTSLSGSSDYGFYDCFVAKFSSHGTLIKAQRFSASESMECKGIVVDSDGNCYITGAFKGNAQFGGFIKSSSTKNFFAAKLNSALNFSWVKSAVAVDAGNYGWSDGKSISIHPDGRVVVAGFFDYEIKIENTTIKSAFGNSIYLASFSSDGQLNWVNNQISGDIFMPNPLALNEICADSKGNTLLIGDFKSSIRFGNTTVNTKNNAQDIFITKINKYGSLLWHKTYGGLKNSHGKSIQLMANDGMAITGIIESTVKFDINEAKTIGVRDILIARFDSSGNNIWAKSVGGIQNDEGISLKVRNNQNILVSGTFINTASFDTISISSNYSFVKTGFLAEFNNQGNALFAIPVQVTNPPYTTLDNSENIIINGLYIGDTKFGNFLVRNPTSIQFPFIAKYGLNGCNGTPAISSFTPTTGSTGTKISITGSNFNSGGTSLLFNNAPASIYVLDNNTIEGIVPKIKNYFTLQSDSLYSVNATGKISVTTPCGIAVSTDSFIAPNPIITRFFPRKVRIGDTLNIIGKNFVPNSILYIDKKAVDSFQIVNDTLLQFTITNQVTDNKIMVTNNLGVAVSEQSLLYFPQPTFNPTYGWVGNIISIYGRNFSDSSLVYFNGVKSDSVIYKSPFHLSARIPKKAATGFITVEDSDSRIHSEYNFIVIPRIDSIYPRKIKPGELITIWGNTFKDVHSIEFEGVSTKEFSILSDSEISVKVPDRITSGNLKLHSSTSIYTLNFYYVIIPKPSIAPDWEWAKGFGGAGLDLPEDITHDGSGNIIITGNFTKNIQLDSNIITSLDSTLFKSFIAKIENNGKLLWSKKIVDNGTLADKRIATDKYGNIYLIGAFGYSTIIFDSIELSSAQMSIILSKFNPEGKLLWYKQIKNSSPILSSSNIKIDPLGDIIFAGTFNNELDFEGFKVSGIKDRNGFISKYDSTGNFKWAKKIDGINSLARGIYFDSSNSIF
jgi:hypothetical protein